MADSEHSGTGSTVGADDRLPFPVLVGDIGGTNARFSIVDRRAGPAAEPEIMRTASFASIDHAIGDVLSRASLRPRSAVIAIAGPVDGDAIGLTNNSWVIRPRDLIAHLGFEEVIVLNDFEAQALAVIALGEEHLEKICGGMPEANAGRVVLGPGTGLGVAGLVYALGRWIPVPGEGGHMDIGPRSAREAAIFAHLETIEGRISGEQILCGRGLVNTYRAVAAADTAATPLTTPAEITAAALAKTDPTAEEALRVFVTCLGRTAGDLALVFKAQGGVFLSGGIAQKIVPALRAADFCEALQDKAPHSALLRTIPVYVMTHPLAALAGLAYYAQHPELFGIETRGRRWRG